MQKQNVTEVTIENERDDNERRRSGRGENEICRENAKGKGWKNHSIRNENKKKNKREEGKSVTL